MMLWAAFTLGLFGSLHCVGMCGPIALAVPGSHSRPVDRAIRSLQYNLGRTASYMSMGLIFGGLGAGIRLAGFQSVLSIAMGAIILILAFFALDFENKLLNHSWLNRFYGWIRLHLGKLLRAQNRGASWTLGVLNGFLPCGLVYAAVFGAISTGDWWKGTVFMGLFGLGTIPLMFSIAYAGQWLNVKWRTRLRKLIPGFLLLMGMMLIMRGLHFELPYDFRFWQEVAERPMCH